MKWSKNFIAFSLLLSAVACTSFDQPYYERASGIRLPQKLKVVESYDNAEYLTITSLKLDGPSLKSLIKKYSFEKLNQASFSGLMGSSYLKEAKPDFKQKQNLYIKSGLKGKGSWTYIIDLQQQLLWAEIQYPDWSGT